MKRFVLFSTENIEDDVFRVTTPIGDYDTYKLAEEQAIHYKNTSIQECSEKEIQFLIENCGL